MPVLILLKKPILILLIFSLLILSPALSATNNGKISISSSEDSLRFLFSELAASGSAGEREEINRYITGLLERTLYLCESFEYPFDSLPAMGRVVSQDNRLRIFTWNYSDSPVDHKYSGFIQFRETDGGSINVFRLEQGRRNKEDFESSVFGVDDWYGALYYQIHDVVFSGHTLYTLIAFDFNDVFSNIKIVDALTFIDGTPVFGAPVFQFRDGIKNRVVFEYSSGVVMMLRYIPEKDMIIYDHLAPGTPGQRGQYRYYGPDFSYDGLRFDRGRWVHQSDVEWRR